jgi:hypothetical protein
MLAFLALLAACAGRWVVRRRRNDALLRELGGALALAAEAEQVHWRLERRYTDDLSELARLRRGLAPFVDGSCHDRRTRWELATSEDGTSFDLAVLAVPVHRSRGYKHLLTARGERGTVAYDSFAEETSYLPRRVRAAKAA